MRLAEAETADAVERAEPRSAISRTAAHCWALLLVRIYECLPLLCPKCGQPMRLIAFILDPPAVLPARAPPQAELDFTQVTGPDEWPEMDQSAGARGEI